MGSVFVWKDVLHPGRQRDRFGQWFTVTARDTAAAEANCKKMIRRGLRVPCVWEHQAGAEPVELSRGDRLADYARHTFGEVRGARRDAAGVLWMLHEVYDPADAEQLTRTKFVSPKLYPSYSDSRGGEYRGVTVAHVAATPTPVQFWQRPFQLLSRRRALYLSYSPEGAAVADDAGDKGKGGDTAGGGKKTLADVIQALRETGMNIPDEVTDETGLVIAIKAAGGSAGGGGDLGLDDELEDQDAGAGAATAAAGGPPMLMSATDPKVKAWAKNDRKDLDRRVRRLFATGRVDRPTALALLRQANAVELSYTADGDLAPNKLVAKVEAYEELPKGVAWSKTGGRQADSRELSATREVDAPGVLDGTGDSAEVLKRQEELAKRFSVK